MNNQSTSQFSPQTVQPAQPVIYTSSQPAQPVIYTSSQPTQRFVQQTSQYSVLPGQPTSPYAVRPIGQPPLLPTGPQQAQQARPAPPVQSAPPVQTAQTTDNSHEYTAQPTSTPGQYSVKIDIPVEPVEPVLFSPNLSLIKKWLTLLLIILLTVSIINSILAIQYYYSIEDIKLKNDTQFLLIMAIINIFSTFVCFISFIISFYFSDTKIMGFITWIIAFLTILFSTIVNVYLFMIIIKYNQDNLFIFALINNTLYSPGWTIMMCFFLIFLWTKK